MDQTAKKSVKTGQVITREDSGWGTNLPGGDRDTSTISSNTAKEQSLILRQDESSIAGFNQNMQTLESMLYFKGLLLEFYTQYMIPHFKKESKEAYRSMLKGLVESEVKNIHLSSAFWLKLSKEK